MVFISTTLYKRNKPLEYGEIFTIISISLWIKLTIDTLWNTKKSISSFPNPPFINGNDDEIIKNFSF
jgi:hypothetical protein